MTMQMGKVVPVMVLAGVQACTGMPRTHGASAALEGVIAAVSTGAPAFGEPIVPSHRGPLLVDAGSFAAHGSVLEPGRGALVPLEDLVPTGAEVRSMEDAVRCNALTRNCSVWKDGLFVRLDSLRRVPGGALEAVATYAWTDRRPTGRSAIGKAQTRLQLERAGDRWRVRKQTLISIT